MLFDDYVLKQIQKIAELVAAIAGRAAGRSHVDVDGELAAAYRELLGMEGELADRMDPASLARLLGDAERVRALALLLRAHGDLLASREDALGAERLHRRALALLDSADDPELRASLDERLAR